MVGKLLRGRRRSLLVGIDSRRRGFEHGLVEQSRGLPSTVLESGLSGAT